MHALNNANRQHSPGFTQEYMYVCLQSHVQWCQQGVDIKDSQPHSHGLCSQTAANTGLPKCKSRQDVCALLHRHPHKACRMPMCTSAMVTMHTWLSSMGRDCQADSCAALTGAPPQVHDLLIVPHVQAFLQHACPKVS